ncbi:hypothetical protein [Fodinibius halophilus]|uniref:Uncharacterized protein n=1 Tax=Fodinibius halophilus TaxID=1736908 RepID=A0A6M1TFW0_9BACT|nr:hypothetical protein [Fodinibius halophilus]NGP89684.1 hypothetical protein [Fodinibius halophilus]
MGKSSSFKESGLPDRAYPNEFEQENSSGESDANQKSELTINLVQINSQIASRASKGDQISLSDIVKTIEAHTASGRIGNIPIHDTEEVRNINYTQAFISGLEKDNYQVEITLRE